MCNDTNTIMMNKETFIKDCITMATVDKKPFAFFSSKGFTMLSGPIEESLGIKINNPSNHLQRQFYFGFVYAFSNFFEEGIFLL